MPREVFEIPRGGLMCPVRSSTRLEHRRTYIPCLDFEVPQGGLFRPDANTQNHVHRERSYLVSRRHELQTLRWRDRYHKERESAASLHEQRKLIPSPIDMGERATRHRHFTEKAIIRWKEFNLVSAFVHRPHGQERGTYTVTLAIRRWKYGSECPKLYPVFAPTTNKDSK